MKTRCRHALALMPDLTAAGSVVSPVGARATRAARVSDLAWRRDLARLATCSLFLIPGNTGMWGSLWVVSSNNNWSEYVYLVCKVSLLWKVFPAILVSLLSTGVVVYWHPPNVSRCKKDQPMTTLNLIQGIIKKTQALVTDNNEFVVIFHACVYVCARLPVCVCFMRVSHHCPWYIQLIWPVIVTCIPVLSLVMCTPVLSLVTCTPVLSLVMCTPVLSLSVVIIIITVIFLPPSPHVLKIDSGPSMGVGLVVAWETDSLHRCSRSE